MSIRNVRRPAAIRGALGILTVLNTVLLGTFLVLNLEPQRSAFARATGLWSSCAMGIGSSPSLDIWSPWLLVILGAPAVAGFALSFVEGVSRRIALASRVVAAVSFGVVVIAVMIPSGTCVG